MVFTTCLGLLVYYRWPTAPEALGITLIVVGSLKLLVRSMAAPEKLLWLFEDAERFCQSVASTS